MSFRNTLLVLLFGGTLGMALLREQPRGTLEPFDRVHREFLKANPGDDRPSAAAHPSVVFARLDDGDQPRPVFEKWPLNESDWLILLQNVPAYGPKVTALCAGLSFPEAPPPLEAAAKAVPGLCVPLALSASPADGAQALPDALPVLKVTGNPEAIPEFKSLRESALPGALAAGEIDLLPAAKELTVDGDWCRVPMLARLGDKVVPTLALRALLEWSGVPAADVTVAPGSAITAGKALRIEIDEAGFFRFFLSLAPQVPSVNADSFVLKRDEMLAHVPADDPQRRVLESIKGSLLWAGLDDSKSRSFRLPGGTPVSRADLTARALAVIQTNTHLLPLPPQRQWIAPSATLLFCIWLTNWRKSRLWPGAVLASAALAGISLWLYRQNQQWLPIGPSLALVLATVLLSCLLPSRGAKPAPETPTRRTVRPQPTRWRTKTPATANPAALEARDRTTTPREPVIAQPAAPRPAAEAAPAPVEPAREPEPGSLPGEMIDRHALETARAEEPPATQQLDRNEHQRHGRKKKKRRQ